MATEATRYNTEAPGMIYGAINEVMKDVGAITKDSRNTFDGYKFRGIDAVLNALQPALKKHGITIVPTVINQVREERVSDKGKAMMYSILTVNYKFYALDGSYIEATVIGEGMDRGDKASNKAMSAAFKYAAFQTFCIPTEEMIDSEIDSPQIDTGISPTEVAAIERMMAETNTSADKFLAYFKVPMVDMLTKSQAKEAVAMLKFKKEADSND